MVAISLILIGGCSVLRSRTSLRTSGSKVPRRAAACSAPNRPRMPSFSKPMIRRRRVVSGVPVWRALSVTGLPKTTGGADPLVLYLLRPLQEQLKLPPVLGGFDPRASGHLPLPSSDTLPSPASL